MTPNDLLAALPPPAEDEPSSLRRDIADELGDHLACALRRELVKTNDADLAHERVLDAFGDPRTIARQLWWQAMWSRIMLQRIAVGVQVVFAAGLLLMAGLLIRVEQRQFAMAEQWDWLKQQTAVNQQLLVQVSDKLRNADFPQQQPAHDAGASMGSGGGLGSMMGGDMGMAGGTAAMGEGMMGGGMSPFGGPPQVEPGATTLSLVLTMERADGPPAAGCVVGLLDDAQKSLPVYLPQVASGGEGGGMGGGMGAFGGVAPMGQPSLQSFPGLQGSLLPPHSQGQVQAGRVDPGRYTAVIEFPNGWYTHHKFVVKPGAQHVEKIVCPKPSEKAFVTITAPPLPEDLRAAGVSLKADVRLLPKTLDRVDWRRLNGAPTQVQFDPQTGHPARLLAFRAQSPSAGPLGGFGPSDGLETDLRNDPPEDRFVVLATGEYLVEWYLLAKPPMQVDDAGVPMIRIDPLLATGEPQRFMVRPGQNAWTLDVTADLFDTARSTLATLKEENAAKPAAPSAPATGGEGTGLGASITTLQVRLASEQVGGPPPASGRVSIKGQDLLNKAIDGAKSLKADQPTLDFGELLPGGYSLDVTAGNFQSTGTIKAIRGEQNVLEVVCPPEPQETAELKVEAPLPADLQAKPVCVLVQYQSVPVELAGRSWQHRVGGTVLFDRSGAKLISLPRSSANSASQGPRGRGGFPGEGAMGFFQIFARILDPKRPLSTNQKSDDGLRPLGWRYQLVGLTVATDPRGADTRYFTPLDKPGVYESRQRGEDDWPKELDEPFEFTAGKTWQIVIPDEMHATVREQLAKQESTADKKPPF